MAMEGEVNEYLNAMREELMKVFPPLPPKGTPYYYIRALPQPEKFGVCEWTWHGTTSDRYRYCQGNIFLNESACRRTCHTMNQMLERVKMKLKY